MTAIFLSDSDSVQRLEAKIAELTKTQEQMKATNKIVQSKKIGDQEKIKALVDMGYTESNARELLKPDFSGRVGFPSYKLTNNNANIKAAQEQLKKAIKLKTTENKEYKIKDVEVIENSEENRLQLFFKGKPEDTVRTELKRNGFRWTPSTGCWQSYLNNYQIQRANNIINSIEP